MYIDYGNIKNDREHTVSVSSLFAIASRSLGIVPRAPITAGAAMAFFSHSLYLHFQILVLGDLFVFLLF